MNKYYKGYWMITNKCNLNCTYCVLEDAPHQILQELTLSEKKNLLSHLYENLNFRRITLSGGEVLLIGKHPPKEFIDLLSHASQYKSSNSADNLYLEVYTNATYFDINVANAMEKTVEEVAVTVDSINDAVLKEIGRKHRGGKKYLDNIVKVISELTARGITIKIHSVISTKNINFLAEELPLIIDAVIQGGGKIDKWKFYQYMSYDVPGVDKIHSVSIEEFEVFKEKAESLLIDYDIKTHYKDNQEMNSSLFNILSYGNAQYMVEGDSWKTSKRTDSLCNYSNIGEMFALTSIDKTRFEKFHSL